VFLLTFQKNFLSFSLSYLSSFSHTSLSFTLLYISYRIFGRESVCLWSRSDHKVFYFVLRRSWRLLSRQACEFALCVVLAGTSEGLVGQKVLEGANCRCCETEWSCRIIVSENPLLRWRRGRRASGSNLETILLCLRLLISLSTHLCLYLTCSYCLHLYMPDINFCLIDIHAWDCLISCMLSYCSYLHMFDIVCVLTFVFNQESYW